MLAKFRGILYNTYSNTNILTKSYEISFKTRIYIRWAKEPELQALHLNYYLTILES